MATILCLEMPTPSVQRFCGGGCVPRGTDQRSIAPREQRNVPRGTASCGSFLTAFSLRRNPTPFRAPIFVFHVEHSFRMRHSNHLGCSTWNIGSHINCGVRPPQFARNSPLLPTSAVNLAQSLRELTSMFHVKRVSPERGPI